MRNYTLALFYLVPINVSVAVPPKEKPEATTSETPLASPPKETAAELLRLHNSVRTEAGKPELRLNERLSSAAQRFAEFLSKARKYEHDADGRTPAARIEAEGYDWGTWSENIGWGTKEPADVMRTWINSEGHRVNILGEEKEVGFGISKDVWVAVFATQLKEVDKKGE